MAMGRGLELRLHHENLNCAVAPTGAKSLPDSAHVLSSISLQSSGLESCFAFLFKEKETEMVEK